MTNIERLLDIAWKAREMAYAWKSGTKVGCAIEATNGQIVCGWNIEGLGMTDLHAEAVAISQLVPLQSKGIRVAVVANTTHFTPCEACVDWLVQFCDSNATIVIQNSEQSWEYQLKDLMFHNPEG